MNASAGGKETAPPRHAEHSGLLDEDEAARIARDLTAKYGRSALDLARQRAAQAIEVGDALAYGAWQAVISAARDALGGGSAMPLALAPADRRGRPAVSSSIMQMRKVS